MPSILETKSLKLTAKTKHSSKKNILRTIVLKTSKPDILKKPFAYLIGCIEGAPDLSKRKGYSPNWKQLQTRDFSWRSQTDAISITDWAVNLLAKLQTPLLTSEAVLSETAFHLQSSRTALLMIESGLVRIAINPEREWPELLRLAEQFDDQRPDLADLCVIRLSEIYPIHKVLTVDGSDFRVYRRNSREPIPVVCPAD